MENKYIKIVVVEDDENLRFLIANRLQKEAFRVTEVSNGNDAAEVILKEDPQIVLLDCMLPGKSGSEICKEIREKGFENLVIMLTAKAQDIDKINAYSFGVSDYI